MNDKENFCKLMNKKIFELHDRNLPLFTYAEFKKKVCFIL